MSRCEPLGQRDFVKTNYICSSSCRKEEDVILSKNERRDENEKVKEEKLEKVEEENRDTKVEIELSS